MTPAPFFSDAWFALVAKVLEPLVAAEASIPDFSLVEIYPSAPPNAAPDGLDPGFRLVFAADQTVRVERGAPRGQPADVTIQAHWEDAARSAQLHYGPDYDALAAERVAGRRLAVSGSIPPQIAKLLRQAHDAIADYTLPWAS